MGMGRLGIAQQKNLTQLKNMNSPSDRIGIASDRYQPSDDDLIEYLLGTATKPACELIETWLACNAENADRMEQFSAVLLVACDASKNFPRETVELAHSGRMKWFPSTVQSVRWLVVAASIAVLLFALDRLRTDRVAQEQIAMVWADSLAESNESEVLNEFPGWLMADSPADEAEGASAVVEDETDSSTDSSVGFGFSTEGPPEWLLAGVREMQVVGTEFETDEETP